MPLELGRIKAICFDVDGTLSDTDDQFVRKLVKLLNPLGQIFHTRGMTDIARRIVMSTEGPGNWAYGLADKLGLDGAIVAMGDLFYQIGIGNSPKPFQIIWGIREMLASLYKCYSLAIISGRGQRSTFRFLHQFDLLSCFKVVATGQTCRHTKPYPDPLIWSAREMGVLPSSCLMVGDTGVDIQCGKKAAAQTVGVLCGFGERKELEKAGADLILEYTPQLVDVLINNKEIGKSS